MPLRCPDCARTTTGGATGSVALPQASPEADHSGFGKDWTSQTRYVPSLLAYLTRRSD